MDLLIKVDIQHGQVQVNNLREFWNQLAAGHGLGSTRNDLFTSTSPGSGAAAGTGLPQRTLPAQTDALKSELRQRISAFNAQPKRKTKNAWSEAELLRLALLVGHQRHNYEQAAARLTRTPRACQFMFRELQKAGVV